VRARRTAPDGEPPAIMPVCVIKRCIDHPVARGLASRCPENSGNRPQEQAPTLPRCVEASGLWLLSPPFPLEAKGVARRVAQSPSRYPRVLRTRGGRLTARHMRHLFRASYRRLSPVAQTRCESRARLTRRPTRYSAGGRTGDPRGRSVTMARCSGPIGNCPSETSLPYRATSGAAPRPVITNVS